MNYLTYNSGTGQITCTHEKVYYAWTWNNNYGLHFVSIQLRDKVTRVDIGTGDIEMSLWLAEKYLETDEVNQSEVLCNPKQPTSN